MALLHMLFADGFLQQGGGAAKPLGVHPQENV
jgi:hypothetical protein